MTWSEYSLPSAKPSRSGSASQTPVQAALNQSDDIITTIFQVDDENVGWVRFQHFAVRGIVTALKFLYLPVSTAALSVFDCSAVDPATGRAYSRFFPDVHCSYDNQVYLRSFVSALIAIPVFVVGFLCFVVFACHRYRHAASAAHLNLWHFMFSEYRPGLEWSIVWSTIRSLLLSVILVLIPVESGANLSLLLVWFCAMGYVQLRYGPFACQLQNFVETAAFFSLVITTGFGFIYSVDTSAQVVLSDVVAAGILLTQIILILILIYAFLISSRLLHPRVTQKWPLRRFILSEEERQQEDLSRIRALQGEDHPPAIAASAAASASSSSQPNVEVRLSPLVVPPVATSHPSDGGASSARAGPGRGDSVAAAAIIPPRASSGGFPRLSPVPMMARSSASASTLPKSSDSLQLALADPVEALQQWLEQGELVVFGAVQSRRGNADEAFRQRLERIRQSLVRESISLLSASAMSLRVSNSVSSVDDPLASLNRSGPQSLASRHDTSAFDDADARPVAAPQTALSE